MSKIFFHYHFLIFKKKSALILKAVQMDTGVSEKFHNKQLTLL